MSFFLPVVAGAQALPQAEEDEETGPAPAEETIQPVPEEGTSDAAIRTRINGIFGSLPALQSVNAEVDDGVVVLEGTVDDVESRQLLSLRQPFRREDHILVDDIEGKVLRLTPRATVLMSLDGNHVRIPNATVFKATIVNYTLNPLRRFEFRVGVATSVDLRRARALAVSALQRTQGVLEAPAPLCQVEALGESSVILTVQAWLDQRESDYHKLRSKAQRVVKEAFDDAGIVMPEPIYNVNLQRRSEEARPAAAETPESPETGTDDTAPDRTVDEQIRAERRALDDTDLLSERAARE